MMPDASPAQLCFVDMPFGKKVEPKSGVEIDFDAIYRAAIRPAVEELGLGCIRGDEERTGGIIHKPMFARLLMCEFVIADLTAANPNVFYELGIRHAARPFTTIPIFATLGAIPFDVAFLRAIPYSLENGSLPDGEAESLKSVIQDRIRAVVEGPTAEDSPLFQLFDNYPGIELSHELTDVFRERVAYSTIFRARLAEARSTGSDEEGGAALRIIEADLGNLAVVERGVLVDLLLSYRDVSDWQAMVDLYERLPPETADSVLCRQQYALALNRLAEMADDGTLERERALGVANDVLERTGASAETYGIVGRIHKSRFGELTKKASEGSKLAEMEAAGALDLAIEAYTKGFEAEPADYYPGVNAINLLVRKGGGDAAAEIDRLTPLVTFAVLRRGGLDSQDYWDLATVLELACIGRDAGLALKALPKVLAAGDAGWKLKTTADNLEAILDLRSDEPDSSQLKSTVEMLREKQAELGA